MRVNPTKTSTDDEIRCPVEGCSFLQHHVDVFPGTNGLTMVSHRCENSRCRRWMSILVQVSLTGRHVRARVVEVHPRLGRDEEAMRRTYGQFAALQDESGRELMELFIEIGIAFGRVQPRGRPISG